MASRADDISDSPTSEKTISAYGTPTTDENSSSVKQKRLNSSIGMKYQTATTEQIRLAQLVNEPVAARISDDSAETSKKIKKLIELTGCDEEKASVALYDADNDVNDAVERILEQAEGDDGFSKACSRKTKRQQQQQNNPQNQHLNSSANGRSRTVNNHHLLDGVIMDDDDAHQTDHHSAHFHDDHDPSSYVHSDDFKPRRGSGHRQSRVRGSSLGAQMGGGGSSSSSANVQQQGRYGTGSTNAAMGGGGGSDQPPRFSRGGGRGGSEHRGGGRGGRGGGFGGPRDYTGGAQRGSGGGSSHFSNSSNQFGGTFGEEFNEFDGGGSYNRSGGRSTDRGGGIGGRGGIGGASMGGRGIGRGRGGGGQRGGMDTIGVWSNAASESNTWDNSQAIGEWQPSTGSGGNGSGAKRPVGGSGGGVESNVWDNSMAETVSGGKQQQQQQQSGNQQMGGQQSSWPHAHNHSADDGWDDASWVGKKMVFTNSAAQRDEQQSQQQQPSNQQSGGSSGGRSLGGPSVGGGGGGSAVVAASSDQVSALTGTSGSSFVASVAAGGGGPGATAVSAQQPPSQQFMNELRFQPQQQQSASSPPKQAVNGGGGSGGQTAMANDAATAMLKNTLGIGDMVPQQQGGGSGRMVVQSPPGVPPVRESGQTAGGGSDHGSTGGDMMRTGRSKVAALFDAPVEMPGQEQLRTAGLDVQFGSFDHGISMESGNVYMPDTAYHSSQSNYSKQTTTSSGTTSSLYQTGSNTANQQQQQQRSTPHKIDQQQSNQKMQSSNYMPPSQSQSLVAPDQSFMQQQQHQVTPQKQSIDQSQTGGSGGSINRIQYNSGGGSAVKNDLPQQQQQQHGYPSGQMGVGNSYHGMMVPDTSSLGEMGGSNLIGVQQGAFNSGSNSNAHHQLQQQQPVSSSLAASLGGVKQQHHHQQQQHQQQQQQFQNVSVNNNGIYHHMNARQYQSTAPMSTVSPTLYHQAANQYPNTLPPQFYNYPQLMGLAANLRPDEISMLQQQMFNMNVGNSNMFDLSALNQSPVQSAAAVAAGLLPANSALAPPPQQIALSTGSTSQHQQRLLDASGSLNSSNNGSSQQLIHTSVSAGSADLQDGSMNGGTGKSLPRTDSTGAMSGGGSGSSVATGAPPGLTPTVSNAQQAFMNFPALYHQAAATGFFAASAYPPPMNTYAVPPAAVMTLPPVSNTAGLTVQQQAQIQKNQQLHQLYATSLDDDYSKTLYNMSQGPGGPGKNIGGNAGDMNNKAYAAPGLNKQLFDAKGSFSQQHTNAPPPPFGQAGAAAMFPAFSSAAGAAQAGNASFGIPTPFQYPPTMFSPQLHDGLMGAGGVPRNAPQNLAGLAAVQGGAKGMPGTNAAVVNAGKPTMGAPSYYNTGGGWNAGTNS